MFNLFLVQLGSRVSFLFILVHAHMIIQHWELQELESTDCITIIIIVIPSAELLSHTHIQILDLVIV